MDELRDVITNHMCGLSHFSSFRYYPPFPLIQAHYPLETIAASKSPLFCDSAELEQMLTVLNNVRSMYSKQLCKYSGSFSSSANPVTGGRVSYSEFSRIIFTSSETNARA